MHDYSRPPPTDWQPPTELPDLRRAGIIALDTETNDEGLRAELGSAWPWHGGYICGVSVAYRADGEIRAHYLPIRHPDSQNFDRAQVSQWLRDHVASNVRFVTQKGLYDWGWLRTDLGITMPPSERLEEIGALATLVDENRRSYSLDSLCAWRGLPGKDETLLIEAVKALGERISKKKNRPQSHIWRLPARYVGRYAEVDPVATRALFENLNPILDKEGTRDAYRLEIDLLPMVHEMRWRGIRVDTAKTEQSRDYCLQKRDQKLAELSDKLGANVSMAEIGRTEWLAATFDQHKISYPRTEKGNPSFTAGNTGWMPKHPHWLPQLIVKAKKYNNAAVNVLETYILGHVVNGRIHAEINPHRGESNGTKSFRFSYSDPPLQLMPSRDEELAPLIRGALLPEEGEYWTDSDISQQEFRHLVHCAAAQGLRKAKEAAERYLNDPDTDFHRLVAELTGLDRKLAKAVNFAKIYGAGIKKFAAMIGKPEAEARAILTRYNRELPFVDQLAKRCEYTAARQGYLELYDGARRHWDAWEAPAVAWTKGMGPCSREEAERRVADPNHPWYRRRLRRADTYTALNALIQGSAARQTKLWMRALGREGIVPLLQMHDALECSVSSREQAELVARLGEEAVQLAVPMRVDLKFGRSWGDAKHTWEGLTC
jgi:DNA polymerase I-like protein with 3'-5' exonuclease and polymerase domains